MDVPHTGSMQQPRSLSELTAARERDQDARMFSKYLTSLVKFPGNAQAERLSWLDATARTAHEKAAVTAITMNDYDVFARRFLMGPAHRRILELLDGFAVPPFARLQGSTSYPEGEWVGDGLPIPLAKPDFGVVHTESSSFGFIVAVARDVTLMSDDRATSAVEAISARSMVAAEDQKILGTETAVSGVHPAGLLASAAEFSGGSPAGLEMDIQSMFAFVTDGKAVRPKFVTSPRAALWMALQRTDGGARFPNARVDGTGDIAGVPLLVSPAAGNKLVLVDTGELAVSDNGLRVTASQEAAVQMTDSPTAGAAQMISGFQTNTTFLRFVRSVWWAVMRDDAVAFTTISDLGGSPA